MKKVFRLLYYSETSLYRHPLNTDTLLLQTVFLVRSPYIDLTHLIWTLLLIRTLFMAPSLSVFIEFDLNYFSFCRMTSGTRNVRRFFSSAIRQSQHWPKQSTLSYH